jgi:hypothetical protein
MIKCALDREYRRTVGKLVDWAVVAGVSCRLTLVWDNFFGEIVRVFVCQSPYPPPPAAEGPCGWVRRRINPEAGRHSHVAILLWRHDPS